MRNNEGVTILQIVITVIVMIILLSLAIFYSSGTTKEATVAALYNEIKEVTSVIQEASILNHIQKSGDEIIFFEETSAPKVEKSSYQTQLALAGSGEFYYLDFTSSRELKNTLELENIKNDYILEFDGLKLYLVEGIELLDETTGKEEIKYSAEEIEKYYNNLFKYAEGEKDLWHVTYNANRGGYGLPASQSAQLGMSITISSTKPTREGYTFMGWSESSGDTVAKYQPGSICKANSNITLYAVWASGNVSPTVIMSDYTYAGAKSTPTIIGNTGGGMATYYYNTVNSNTNGIAWSNVKTSSSLNVGTYYMYAVIGATSKFEGATTPTVEFKVNKANGSINFSRNTITKSLEDGTFTNRVTKVGDGTVTYSSSNPNVATVASNGEVTIVGGGSATITATVIDGKNYTYSTKTASYTLIVGKADVFATVNMAGYTYNGTLSEPSVVGYDGSGAVTYYYSATDSNSGGTIWSGMTSTSLNAGTYYMYAVIAESLGYKGFTTAPVSFVVEKANGSISFASGEVKKKAGDEPFTNVLTKTGDGTVTYTSSKPSVATVDANGKVTMYDSGETIITATVTDGVNYKYTSPSNTASYTLKVEVPVYYLMQRGATNYAIGSSTYKADSIKTITFETSIPDEYVSKVGNDNTVWDVSRDSNKTVLAWVTVNSEDSTKYDLHIGANIGAKGKIMAPENSGYLFGDYSNCVTVNNLKLLDTRYANNMSYMFQWCSKLTSLTFGDNFDTSKVTDMSYMFQWCRSLTSLDVSKFDTSKVINMGSMFSSCSKLTSLTFGDNFDTSKVTSMSSMFSYCSGLTSLDLSKFDTSKVTSMSSMFFYCSKLTSLTFGDNFDTSKVTNMSSMFSYCSKLTSLTFGDNFDTSKVTDMSYMFQWCSSLTSLDVSKFDTSSVTNMVGMFSGCQELIDLDLSNFNTSQVISMAAITSGNGYKGNGMFEGCYKLKSLDISNFDTSKVIYMDRLFCECRSLTSLNVSSFNTSNVTSMADMFNQCEGLTSLNLSNFDTSQVEDMSNMFWSCTRLTSLNLSNFDTSQVEDMSNMFWSCTRLTSLNLSNFDTSYVTNTSEMFYYCRSLTSINVSNWNTQNVKCMGGMFYYCRSLTTLDLSSFDTVGLDGKTYSWRTTNEIYVDTAHLFEGCYNLKTIIFGEKFDKFDGYGMFKDCVSLKTIISLKEISSSGDAPILSGTENKLNSNNQMISGPNGLKDLPNAILYVMNTDSERAFESAENYLTVFGSASDVVRDDGSTDIYRIRPILELVGDSEVSIEIGGTYSELGVKVAGMSKNVGGDYTPFGYTVSSSIKDRNNKAVNQIDTSKVGTYTVTYKLLDASGEVAGAEITRIVRVTTIHSVANGPYLNTREMKAVYWNESGEEMYDNSFLLSSEEEIYNTTLYNYDFDDEAYELKKDTYDINWNIKPRWANAMTKDDGSYWVWIPRYAYKITYYTDAARTTLSSNNAKTQYGYIDVIFLYGASNNQFEDKQGNIRTLPDDYIVHPAFQAMSQEEATEGNRLGKWDMELTGIWVAKYEASQEILTSTESGEKWVARNTTNGDTGNILTTNAGNTDSTKSRVVSKPSVNSWRKIANKYIYQNCLKMNETLNTHQMKNSEWGAVAYLTYSVYGRNGNELAVNQCSSFYTGAGLGSGTSTIANSTYSYSADTFDTTYAWNTDLGKLTSTTGNIYGIYDMSGGAYEYTASYVNNGHDDLMVHGNDSENSGDNLVNDSEVIRTRENMRTKQIYLSTTSSGEATQSADYNLCKDENGDLLVYGDAVYETSTKYNDCVSWGSDYSSFPNMCYPFYLRGGDYSNPQADGIFAFACGYGGEFNGTENFPLGFRPVICIAQK